MENFIDNTKYIRCMPKVNFVCHAITLRTADMVAIPKTTTPVIALSANVQLVDTKTRQ